MPVRTKIWLRYYIAKAVRRFVPYLKKVYKIVGSGIYQNETAIHCGIDAVRGMQWGKQQPWC
jgi:hypothetical protein